LGTRSTTKAALGPGSEAPSAGSLASLSVLGVLSALWALFLWAELVLSRTGGTPFCALGPAADCGRVWDSAFAVAVSRWTGLPVAGWGLVWGLVAFVLPLGGLLRLAEARRLPGALVSAVRLNAAAGVVSVFVMLAVSAAEKAFCVGCFATYLLVAGYAGIALFGWQRAAASSCCCSIPASRPRAWRDRRGARRLSRRRQRRPLREPAIPTGTAIS